MRLRLGPAILLGGGIGAWLGGLSYSSEGILSYWGLVYSCRLEGDMEPREERWLPTLVKLRAVETRLFGGGTSSLWEGEKKNKKKCSIKTCQGDFLNKVERTNLTLIKIINNNKSQRVKFIWHQTTWHEFPLWYNFLFSSFCLFLHVS